MSVCIFCLNHQSRNLEKCSYGMQHEYPEAVKPKQKVEGQAKKVDAKLCTKCKLHPKNPLSATNGCAHEYA